MNSKVIASCYVSYGGQESHQRIRKGRDGHGLENPTDVKKKCKENSKVIMVFKVILKKLLALFSFSNNRTSTHFASEHAKRFQK